MTRCNKDRNGNKDRARAVQSDKKQNNTTTQETTGSIDTAEQHDHDSVDTQSSNMNLYD